MLPRQLHTCTGYWLSRKSLGTKTELDLQAVVSLVRYHELHVIQDLLTPSEHLVSMVTHHIGQCPLHSEQYLWLILFSCLAHPKSHCTCSTAVLLTSTHKQISTDLHA